MDSFKLHIGTEESLDIELEKLAVKDRAVNWSPVVIWILGSSHKVLIPAFCGNILCYIHSRPPPPHSNNERKIAN